MFHRTRSAHAARQRRALATAQDAPSFPECESEALATSRAGDRIEILSVDDPLARVQALRFGIAEGAVVECVTRIPAGPIVVRSGRQEIAIGRGLARRVRIKRIGTHANTRKAG